MRAARPDLSLLGATALAPLVWGSTYLVTQTMLPAGVPLTIALLRALPAGLLLLVFVRRLPTLSQWPGLLALGGLNFALFWTCLFIAAYRLPGGVAATLGASQALLVVFIARGALGTPIRRTALLAGLTGLAGVAMIALTAAARLDLIGVAAALIGAASMAAGTVYSRKLRGDTPLLTFTAWQLLAGGLLLLPLALIFEPGLPPVTGQHLAGLAWLGLIGAAASYALWFRGVARIEPSAVSVLGFLSPLTAVLLGWWVLEESFTLLQALGAVLVFAAILLGQQVPRRSPFRLRRGHAVSGQTSTSSRRVREASQKAGRARRPIRPIATKE
ncbi:DMT family transporter [Maricaulis parjimensis]|uniref:DMT family transporter n=1 Tax=Maricaulis parjimensis TaxID=144023 RepID=UPI001939F8E3|nr:EamA family transporter [Maricaulis parjimensis]